MRFEKFSFGSIQIDGKTYEYDLTIDRGDIRKRRKKPSKKFRERFGHTPLCKRRMVAYFAIGLTTLLSYPSALAILGRRIPLVMLLQFFIAFFGLGLLHGLAPILTSETFPTKFRYSGTGISFALAGILGGMIALPLLARLIGQHVLHNWYYLPMVYVVYCAAAMLALLFVPETRDSSLEDLDVGKSQVASAIP